MSDVLDGIRELSPIDRLCYWISSREAVRLSKENGDKAPWTNDPILQSYRFCNVVRMDDKVSRWLYLNWYQPYKDHPNMLVACAIARFFNKPESLELITKSVFTKSHSAGTVTRIKEILRAYRDKGNTLFNGAYMVRGNDGVDKVSSVMDFYVKSLDESNKKLGLASIVDSDSMEATWKNIIPCHGWGSFMAGQVVADLRWAVTGTWADKDSWAPAGPGSMRGLNRLLERPLKQSFSQEEFVSQLQEVRRGCCDSIPRCLSDRMELHDWQNCMCEYDKYNRVLFGEGRPKQLYRGGV